MNCLIYIDDVFLSYVYDTDIDEGRCPQYIYKSDL